jgi:hypothetical protein
MVSVAKAPVKQALLRAACQADHRSEVTHKPMNKHRTHQPPFFAHAKTCGYQLDSASRTGYKSLVATFFGDFA